MLQIGAVIVLLTLVLTTPSRGQTRLVDLTANEGAHRRLDFWRETLPAWFPTNDVIAPHALHSWGIRAALLSLLMLQILAIVGCARQVNPSHVRWFVGPLLSAFLLLLFPPLSADLFYYAISGYAVTEGINPYLTPPAGVSAAALLTLNDWRDITSPYGPVWTQFSALISRPVGADPIAAAVVLKVFALACAAGLVGLVYSFAHWLTADRRNAMVAAIFVAWQPALLVESAGTGHNDAFMSLLALGGLWLVFWSARGSTRAGLVLITLSALVKYATLPVLALALLWRVSQCRSRPRQLAITWTYDLMAISATVLLAFAPFWEGWDTVDSLTDEPARLFTNPLWLLVERVSTVFGAGVPERASTIGATLTAALNLGLFAWLLVRLRNVTPESPQAKAWLIQACAMSLIGLTLFPINVHAWYVIWPLGAVAIAGVADPHQAKPNTHRVPRWLWFYFFFAAVTYLGYHTRLGAL